MAAYWIKFIILTLNCQQEVLLQDLMQEKLDEMQIHISNIRFSSITFRYRSFTFSNDVSECSSCSVSWSADVKVSRNSFCKTWFLFAQSQSFAFIAYKSMRRRWKLKSKCINWKQYYLNSSKIFSGSLNESSHLFHSINFLIMCMILFFQLFQQAWFQSFKLVPDLSLFQF